MVSIVTVAKAAGVGKSTVSRYLNKGYVSEESRSRIEKAMKELGYVPSTSGRSLRMAKSFAMAICVPMISHPFFSRFAERLESAVFEQAGEASRRLNQVIIVSGNEQERLKWLRERNLVDGAFLVTHEKFDPSSYDLPIVTVDRLMGKEVPVVTSDNYESTYKALLYLYEKGNREIGFIGGRPAERSEVMRRYDAYMDFTKEKGLPVHAFYEDFAHGEEMKASSLFLEREPRLDAVFATSDTFGFQTYRRANEVGYGHLDIVSFDGCMDDIIQKPLFTSVKQDIDALARSALELLLRKMNGEECPLKVVVKTTFRKGDTA